MRSSPLSGVVFRRSAGLLGPGGMILFLLLWFFSRPASLYWLPVIRITAPLLVGGLALLLAIRFGLWRLFYGAAVLAMALSWVVASPGEVQFGPLFLVLCADFLVFSVMPAGKIIAVDTAVRLGLLFAQFPLVSWLAGSDAVRFTAILEQLTGAVVPPFGFVIGGLQVAALFFLLRSFRRGDIQVAGFFWVTVAMIVSLAPEKKLVMPEHVLYLIGPALLFAVCLEAAYDLAFRDRLTGLEARRSMDDFLRRLTPPYVVAMVDIDFFKKFNDRFGHDVGDQVLAKVASVLSSVGGGGRPFRYGGEEFAIIFPGSGCEKVTPHLERLRRRIEEQGFTVRSARKKSSSRGRVRGGGRKVGLTVSIGLAEAGRGQTAAETLKKADQALYRAKSQGRNRVCRASS